MRVKSENEVVSSVALRKSIIDEINGPENLARKNESYRRHVCYKDKTKNYVLEELLKQFDEETVREMGYSISNISVGRKIIDKLARVYSQGVLRTGKDDKETNAIEEVSKSLDMNRAMKRTNRYLRMHHNTVVGVLPCPNVDLNSISYDIKLQVFQPHLYDVIEDYYNREKSMFVILSNYKRIASQAVSVDPARAGRGVTPLEPRKTSDGKDQSIADKKEDENADQDQYIWWSKHYHFTTNEKGEMLFDKTNTNKEIQNPISEMPFINFAMDQEGSYWAEGGEDIFDGAVHINCMITNTQHIGVTQGYGQFWMRGKNVPRHVKAGVNKSILLEYEKDDPTPEIGFAASNPKLQELKEQIVMYVALLLTTNNLSTKAVASELSGSQDFASGISLIIDKAESIEDVQDQRDVFYQNEPKIFDLVQRWQEKYKSNLSEEFQQNLLPKNVEVKIKFNDARPIMSEKEKLENMKLRKDLGITSMIEMLMIDDPDLTQKDAEEKLLKLIKDRMLETANSLNKDESNNDNPKDPKTETEEKTGGDKPEENLEETEDDTE